MAHLRNPANPGRRNAKRENESGALNDRAILETIFVQALVALDEGEKPRSSASVTLPPPVLKLIRKHAIADVTNKLLALRIAVDRCTSSKFHAGSGFAKKETVDAALATARKLKSLLQKIDKACGEDLIIEPINDGSLAHPVGGSSFAVLPGPRKKLLDALDTFIAIEQQRVKAAPSKGGRPPSYLNGACEVLARVFFDGRSFRLNMGDHVRVAEELFGDLFATANGSDAIPRLRDAVVRSRDAVCRSSRKTGKK